MKIIGIAGSHAYFMKEKFDNYSMTYVAQDYITAVIKAGGIPVILPINKDKKIAEKYINMIDGLLLTGGKDVDPKLYNQKINEKNGSICKIRDESDSLYFKIAFSKKKPILGVCRGFQLINVLMGGTLFQDVSLCKRSTLIEHDPKNTKPEDKVHKVKINKDSFIGQAMNSDKELVNSFHHQIIDKLAPELKPIAYSEDDVIEGFEYTKNNNFIITTQWHPEMLAAKDDKKNTEIFKKFIERI